MTPSSSSSQPESTQSTRVIRFGVFEVKAALHADVNLLVKKNHREYASDQSPHFVPSSM